MSDTFFFKKSFNCRYFSLRKEKMRGSSKEKAGKKKKKHSGND